jgi:hypothetical protein
VRELLTVAERARHGRGEATGVDTSVRDAWRIAPAKLHFTNPAWRTGMCDPPVALVSCICSICSIYT